MSKKKKSDSPYLNHSVEDVAAAEAGSYYIQLGGDIFVTEEGKMAFDKERVDFLFKEIWDGLIDMKENGTKQEADDAIKCLSLLRIYPLRIH